MTDQFQTLFIWKALLNFDSLELYQLRLILKPVNYLFERHFTDKASLLSPPK